MLAPWSTAAFEAVENLANFHQFLTASDVTINQCTCTCFKKRAIKVQASIVTMPVTYCPSWTSSAFAMRKGRCWN